MANLITWENTRTGLAGFVRTEISGVKACTYEIKNTSSLKCYPSIDNVWPSIPSIRFASLEDAKQCAELIERGRCAD